NGIQPSCQSINNCFKSSAVFIRYRLGRRQLYLQRVDLHAVLPEAITQVGPACKTCASYIPDRLPLPNANTSSNAIGDVRHVEVLRGVGAVVSDLDIIAIV